MLRVGLGLFVMIIFLVAFNPQTTYAKVKINQSDVTIVKGQSIQLRLLGTKEKAVWSSSNKKVATVSSKGKVTGKKNGMTIIKASISHKTYRCKVCVETPQISLEHRTCYVGDQFNITLNGCKHKIKWKSSDDNLVTVKNGHVTAKSLGTVIVTANVHNKEYMCYVTVKDMFISMEQKERRISVGETEKLVVKKNGADVIDSSKLFWSSSDESIASVDSNGYIKAFSEGTVIITARLDLYRTQCVLYVKKPKSIGLDKTTLTLCMSETTSLCTLYNNFDEGDDKRVFWSTSEKGVATVSDTGVITAKAPGATTITATCDGYTAICSVTVLEKKLIISSISETISVGEKVNLAVRYEGFPNSEVKTIIWSSAENSIATVQNGIVTGVGSGSSIITVKSGDCSDTCVIYVVEKSEL